MSTAREVPAFFKSMGSDSPARPRQKFCGMFCPVEGSSDSKTLDFDALSACRGRSDGRVIDRQTDISQPRKVEIRESTGKEALQNLGDKRVNVSSFFLVFLSGYNFCHPTFRRLHKACAISNLGAAPSDTRSSLFKLLSSRCMPVNLL